MQRATTASGLMLMGVRVYNPVTNQFSSVDAVSGGNESPYGYPNDPVNKNDFSGLFSTIVGDLVGIYANLLSAFVCMVSVGLGCLIGNLIIGAISGAIQGALEVARLGGTKKEIANGAFTGFISAVLLFPLSFFLGGQIRSFLQSRPVRAFLEKNLFRKLASDVAISFTSDKITSPLAISPAIATKPISSFPTAIRQRS
jgi:RHS repeat-associated protein